jgi:hypothetical protein
MGSQVNKGAAPICNANPDQPRFFSPNPSVFNFTPPNINSPESIIQTIIQLQRALTPLVNPPTANNLPPNAPASAGGSGSGAGGGAGGGLGGGGKKPPAPPQDNTWQETGRVTQNVKVVNPDDDSQFVIIKEIVSITMTRPSTGETFTLKRDAG